MDMDSIIKSLHEERKKKAEMADALRKAGINTDGMNFGGGGGLPDDKLAELLANLEKNRRKGKSSKDEL